MIKTFFSPLDPADIQIGSLTTIRRVTAKGWLFDDEGFPIHTLGMDGIVYGHIHHIEMDNRGHTLGLLDRFHKVETKGLRRTIALIGQEMVWAYHWTGPLPLHRIEHGDWVAHQRGKNL